MALQYTHWTLDQDDQDLAWLTLDVADNSTNILSLSVLDEFRQILDRFEEHTPAGIAIVSGKPRGFIAGADIREFAEITRVQQALEKIYMGHSIMDQLDQLTCPTVAIINGFCLGGGLELALCCDYRVALDDPGVRFSFPEIKLGIHPGYGGTVRALRHLSPLAAMDLMLTGRSIDARRAKKIGLVDHVVPDRQLRNAARRLLLGRPPVHQVPRLVKFLNSRPARLVLAPQMRRQVSRKAPSEHYPAPHAIIDHWAEHYGEEEKMLQYEGPKSSWVEFFDRPVSVHKAIAVFALTSEAPVMVFTATRRGGLFAFDVRLEGLVDPAEASPETADNQTLSQWYTSLLEGAIRREPAQYWWVHNRWRGVPPKVTKRRQAA